MVKLTEGLWDVASSFERLEYEQLNSKIRFYLLNESVLVITTLIAFLAGRYLYALLFGALTILSFVTALFYDSREAQLLLLLRARVAYKKAMQDLEELLQPYIAPRKVLQKPAGKRGV